MGSNNKFVGVFYRELGRIISSPLYLVVLLVIPVFTIVFLATIFATGQIQDAPVGVVDYTNSQLSGQIIDKIDASQKLAVKNDCRFLNEKQAHEALQKMEIYGYLVIPPEFDSKLYSGKKPALAYYYQKSLLATGEEVNGEFLTILGEVAASFIGNRTVAMPIEGISYPLYNADMDFVTYIAYPFIFVFLQILLIVLVVYVICTEKGSLEWLQCANGSTCAAICGKLLVYFIIFSIYTLITNFVCFSLLKIPVSQNLLSISFSGILLIASTIAVGVMIAVFIPNTTIAISIASMYGALGATMCGVTFPIEQMDKWVQLLSILFPIRHFTLIYHNIVYLNLPFSHNTEELLLMLLPLLLFSLLQLSLLLLSPILLPSFKTPAAWSKKLLKNLLLQRSTFSRLPSIYGVILIVAGGTVGYSILYNIIYAPNIVTDVPTAVVDASHSKLSHKYTSYLNATQGVCVYTNAADMNQARELMESRKIKGIVYIPSEFESRIAQGKGSSVTVLGSTASLLYYLAIQSSTTAAMLQLNAECREEIINTLTLPEKLTLLHAPQVNIQGTALYNPKGGYATFLIPAVLIVALFQTMVMAIGVYMGSSNNSSNNSSKLRIRNNMNNISNTIVAFYIVYLLLALFVTGAVPQMFDLPFIGNFLEITIFAALFLLAAVLFSILLSLILARISPNGESINLIVPFFSIGLIFLSGISFPRESMHPVWQLAYYIIPCPAAITGYIKLNSMGADLTMLRTEIITLVIQSVIYGTLVLALKPANKKGQL